MGNDDSILLDDLAKLIKLPFLHPPPALVFILSQITNQFLAWKHLKKNVLKTVLKHVNNGLC